MKRAFAFALILTLAACGGNNTSIPTTPSTTATFGLSGQVNDNTTGTGISGAIVSIAESPNAGKSATTDASGNYTFAGLQQSGFTVTVSANNYLSQSKGVTLTSNQTLSFQLTRQGSLTPPAGFSLSEFKDFIEALFFESGPLAAGEGSAPSMDGWQPGSHVTILLGTSLSGAQQSYIIATAAQAAQATNGAITAVTQASADAAPQPVDGQIAALAMAPSVSVCGAIASGCSYWTSSGAFIVFGTIVTTLTANPMPHELGHLLYGFHHLNPSSHAYQVSVMGFGNNSGHLSDADIAALQAVYRAGMHAGATPAMFRAAGLIN